MHPLDLDAVGQARAVAGGDVSPKELVTAAIERIEALNPTLNAVIHRLFDEALAAVDDLPEGPLRGVPVVAKDLDGSLAGWPYHCGMAYLKERDHRATTDSHSHALLRRAGAVFVGKTNCPELGLIPSTEPLAYGPTRNPFDLGRTTGGSSGGSAAAVAARMVAAGTAGDGGGSIRWPAAACGLVGLKPSRGRVSLGPEQGEAWAGFVVRGMLVRSVRDAAAFLDVQSVPLQGDPYIAPPPARPFAQEVGADPGRLRIGLMKPVPLGIAALQPDPEAAVDAAGRLLEDRGHHVEEAYPEQLGNADLVGHFINVINVSVARELDHWSAVTGAPITAEDVEPGTWMQAESGRMLGGPDYLASLHAINEHSRAAAGWWEDHDLLLTPAAPEPPPTLGQFHDANEPLAGLMRAAGIVPYLAPFNASGQPAIALPLHRDANGLPVGVQLVAAYGREDLLLRVAAQLEDAFLLDPPAL